MGKYENDDSYEILFKKDSFSKNTSDNKLEKCIGFLELGEYYNYIKPYISGYDFVSNPVDFGKYDECYAKLYIETGEHSRIMAIRTRNIHEYTKYLSLSYLLPNDKTFLASLEDRIEVKIFNSRFILPPQTNLKNLHTIILLSEYALSHIRAYNGDTKKIRESKYFVLKTIIERELKRMQNKKYKNLTFNVYDFISKEEFKNLHKTAISCAKIQKLVNADLIPEEITKKEYRPDTFTKLSLPVIQQKYKLEKIKIEIDNELNKQVKDINKIKELKKALKTIKDNLRTAKREYRENVQKTFPLYQINDWFSNSFMK